MTQNSDPDENAMAERINGILKQEFNIDKYHKDLSIMKQSIKKRLKSTMKKDHIIPIICYPKPNASAEHIENENL